MFTKKQAIRKAMELVDVTLPESALKKTIYDYLWSQQREPRKAPRVYYPQPVEQTVEYPKAGEFF